MTEVWHNEEPTLDGSKLMVLVILADFANDEGICWPSLPTVAKRAKLSDKQVARVVKWLVDNGYVRIISKGDGRKSTVYEVLARTKKDVTPGVSPMSSQPPHPRPPWEDIAVSPDPLIEPSKEPSGSGRKRPTRAKSKAVEKFREITHRYPNAPAEGAIDMAVDDTHNALSAWENVVREWMLRGFSPVNIKGMLEWYEKGIPSYTKKEKESERERIMREWREQDEKPGQGS